MVLSTLYLHTGVDPVVNRMVKLLHLVVANILLSVACECYHRQRGLYAVPSAESRVRATDLGLLRERLNIPAAIGVYLQLLQHLKLPASQLHVYPSELIEGVLDAFVENPLLIMPYIWSCEKDVGTYINERIRNVCDFAHF